MTTETAKPAPPPGNAPKIVTADLCWRLVNRGALPPASAVGKEGQPTWDLFTLVRFYRVPLDALMNALEDRARSAEADTDAARKPIDARDRTSEWPIISRVPGPPLGATKAWRKTPGGLPGQRSKKRRSLPRTAGESPVGYSGTECEAVTTKKRGGGSKKTA